MPRNGSKSRWVLAKQVRKIALQYLSHDTTPRDDKDPKFVMIIFWRWQYNTGIYQLVSDLSWGGATHMSEVYGYVPLWQPRFSGSSATPEATFLHLMSVLMPSIFHFLKNSAFLGPFLSDFGKISAANTLILAKICSQDPSFFFFFFFFFFTKKSVL